MHLSFCLLRYTCGGVDLLVKGFIWHLKKENKNTEISKSEARFIPFYIPEVSFVLLLTPCVSLFVPGRPSFGL